MVGIEADRVSVSVDWASQTAAFIPDLKIPVWLPSGSVRVSDRLLSELVRVDWTKKPSVPLLAATLSVTAMHRKSR